MTDDDENVASTAIVVIHGHDVDLESSSLSPETVTEGPRTAGNFSMPSRGGINIGVFENEAGVVTGSVPVDEVIVVLSGRATIQAADGEPLDLVPGDLARIPADTKTTWTFRERFRIAYILGPAPSK